MSVASRSIHYFWCETKENWRFALPLAASIPAAILCMNYLGPLILSQIINTLTAGHIPSDQLWATFGGKIIAFICLMIFGELVMWRLAVYLVWKMEVKVMYNLNRRSFAALTGQSMHFHTSRFGGSLVSQVNKFSSAYERLMDTLVFSVLPLLVSFAFTFVILGPKLPVFTAILAVLAAIFMVFAWASFKSIRPLNDAEAEAQNHQSGQLADSVTNIVAVKASGREEHERDLYAAANERTRHASLRLMRAVILRDVGFGGVIVAISALFLITLVFGQAWFGAPIGTLVLAIMYSLELVGRLWDFNNVLRQINRALGDAREMTKTLDAPVLVHDIDAAPDLRVTAGAVDFSHVTFWHSDASDNESVFTDFSLHIPAGQRVGLVGRSGSGKTTLTKMLLRFADVQDGHITIDGQDISAHTQASLRRQIAYVPQEPMLFHRTLRENIAYDNPGASDEQIIAAARAANAWEFIERLPEGLGTLCGERGVKLSGGQRQRVAIARAILKDAPVLVLDEATSALDSESERLIQDALVNLMQGRTSIVIAHRLSTVARLDRIVVLADGQVVEDGPHDVLVARDGEYATLWDRQTGAFETDSPLADTRA